MVQLNSGIKVRVVQVNAVIKLTSGCLKINRGPEHSEESKERVAQQEALRFSFESRLEYVPFRAGSLDYRRCFHPVVKFVKHAASRALLNSPHSIKRLLKIEQRQCGVKWIGGGGRARARLAKTENVPSCFNPP